MRRLRYALLALLLGATLTLTSTGCGSTKEGCPVNENATVKAGRNGKLSNKRGKSSLFPKNMKRRKSKRRKKRD